MFNLKTSPKNTPFHLYLSYFFVGLVLFFGAVSTWHFQSSTERLLLNEAREHFENFNANATNHINDDCGSAIPASILFLLHYHVLIRLLYLRLKKRINLLYILNMQNNRIVLHILPGNINNRIGTT